MNNTQIRANVPSWLSDPDGVAPCMCGRPLRPGEIPIIATGELGMRRWFHAGCWNMMVNQFDDDDIDWDDEDDEE